MDRIIERHLTVAPEAARPELLERLTLLKNDPAFEMMLSELRRSART